jgi:hypothetical protein
MCAAWLGCVAAGCFPDPADFDVVPTDLDEVRGNSPLVSASGESLIRDGLILTGHGFGGAPAVTLARQGGAEPGEVLALVSVTETRLEVRLPSDVQPGAFTLRVTGATGEAGAALELSQGLPGPDAPLVLAGVYTWDGLSKRLPPAETLLSAAEAEARYAGVASAIDLEAYAPATQGVASTLGGGLDPYARRADLDDPSGYPTEAQALEQYAKKASLPDISGALTLSELPDWSAAATEAWAVSVGVPLGGLPEGALTPQEATTVALHKAGPLGPAQLAAIAELVTTAEALPASCPAGTAEVGDTCVDVFEARVKEGSCAAGGPVLGAAGVPYPVAFAADGTSGGDVFVACSVADGAPSAGLTWFQAAAACSASGARLCAPSEWIAAVAGTDAGECVSVADGPAAGAEPGECESPLGVRDGVGNVAEWTSAWIQGGLRMGGGELPAGAVTWPGGPGLGVVSGWNGRGALGGGAVGAAGVPAAIVLGGSFADGEDAGPLAMDAALSPLAQSAEVGFRCCRDR